MFEKRTAGVDVATDPDTGGVRLAVSAGSIGAAIVDKKLRLKMCVSRDAPVTEMEFPLPPGRVVAISIYPSVSLVMANGDLMVWNSMRWEKYFNLAGREHNAR